MFADYMGKQGSCNEEIAEQGAFACSPGANGFILGETPGEKDARERQALDSEAMTCLNIVLEQLRAADASRLMRVHNCSSECHVVLERHMNK